MFFKKRTVEEEAERIAQQKLLKNAPAPKERPLTTQDISEICAQKYGNSYLAMYISKPSQFWIDSLSWSLFFHIHWHMMNEIAQRLIVRRMPDVE